MCEVVEHGRAQGGESSTPDHRNNIGFLRLAFAASVIIGHVPYLMGHEEMELLSRIYPDFGFGAFGVDMFFVISGYLISSSFLSSAKTSDYLVNRILRIYPGFLVASVVSILVAVRFGGGQWPTLGDAATRMILLSPPQVTGAYADTHYAVANGSMWTISHEFRCYLLVALAGTLGLLRFKRAVLFAVFGLCVLMVAQTRSADLRHLIQQWGVIPFMDEPLSALRFFAIFGVGICFRLFREDITYSTRAAGLTATSACILMVIPPIREIALVSLGGYSMFWFAFAYQGKWARCINSKTDISYGAYLYAWPVTMALFEAFPRMSILTMAVATLVLAGLAGVASFLLVEKPMLRFRPERQQPYGVSRQAFAHAIAS